MISARTIMRRARATGAALACKTGPVRLTPVVFGSRGNGFVKNGEIFRQGV
jgi:hypothetical protein